LATSTVSGTLLTTAGAAFPSAGVTAYRVQSPELQTTANSADPVTATTDASGIFSLSLYRNTTIPVQYKLQLPNGSYGTFVISPGDATTNLGILTCPSTPFRTDVSTILRDNQNRFRAGIPTQNVTVATTSNTDVVIVAPYSGTLASVQANTGTTLATNDTNYVTFTVTNVTNSNAAMVAATNAETTKVTGGSAWTASTVRTIALSGTAANLIVAQGDVIRVRYGVTGTLGGALSNASILLRFTN
jgi:hypothetical protein